MLDTDEDHPLSSHMLDTVSDMPGFQEVPKRRGKGFSVFLVIMIIVLVLLVAIAVLIVKRPDAIAQVTGGAFGSVTSQVQSGSDDFSSSSVSDAGSSAQSQAGSQTALSSALPLVATCDGVQIHSAIRPADLTTVLFHQASYDYALVMETQLPEADPEAAAGKGARVNHQQTTGEWLDADALHLYRVTDSTSMDTSIDLGADAGTAVYAPVTGTVVLVKDYDLYDEVPDIEIHIQPEGRSDLDCVVLHTTDPLVKAGDKVVGGVTPISYVRDINSVLTDIQLDYYTSDSDTGNHTHVQINNADAEGYRETKLEGALSVS